jgi:hypothetical protein
MGQAVEWQEEEFATTNKKTNQIFVLFESFVVQKIL